MLTFCYHLLCNFLNNNVPHYENFKIAIYSLDPENIIGWAIDGLDDIDSLETQLKI